MTDEVRLKAFYPDPPEVVWDALTRAEFLSRWLMPTDFQPLIGFRFRFEKPDGTAIRGTVTDSEPARLLAYTWNEEDGQESLVVWRLTPRDGGTALTLEHVPLESTVTRIPIDAYFNWRYALRHNLPGLLQLLRTVPA